MTYTRQETGRYFMVLGIVLLVAVGIPILYGFAFQGFDNKEVVNELFFIVAFSLTGAVMLTFSYFVNNSIDTGDIEFGESVFFAAPGEFPSIGLFKKFTIPQLFLLSLIIIWFIGLIAQFGVEQGAFLGVLEFDVPTVQQQFTQTQSFFYNIMAIPAAENLFLVGLAAFILTIFRIAVAKYDLADKNSYKIFGYVLYVVSYIILWVAWHNLRYGGSDRALTAIGLFGGVGGIITVGTGSFMPFWVLHIVNNFFIGLKIISDNAIVLLWVMWFIMVGAYLAIYVFDVFGIAKRRRE